MSIRARGAIIAALFLASCGHGYQTLDAAARSGSVAIAAFEQYDHDHKRELLAAHPECRAAPGPDACYQAVLAPYLVERDQVIAVIDALAPSLQEASHVAEQGAADGLAVRIAGLTASVLESIAKLRGAK